MFQRTEENSSTEEADAWDGTVMTIKKMVTSVKTQVQELISKLSADVAANKEETNTQINAVKQELKADIKELDTKMTEIIKLLTKS